MTACAATGTSNSLVSVAGGLSTLVGSAVNGRQYDVLVEEIVGDRVDGHINAGPHVRQGGLEAAQRQVGRRGHGAGHGDEAVEAWAEGGHLLDKVASRRQLDGLWLSQRRRQRRSPPITT